MKKLSLLITCLLAAPVWADDTLTVSKDSFLMQGSANRNEGANHILRLQSSGNNRALLAFDVSGVSLTGLQQATLVLTISDISTNWSTAGRPVRVHRLLETFTEGNGWNVGNNIRGTGAGVTWKCATDDDIDNSATDCTTAWDGGNFAAATAAAVIHANGTTGEISFDVTLDVAALGAGASEAAFIVKKENEGQSGQVEYFSKEAAAAAGDMSLAARLILVTETPNQPPDAVDDEALTATNRAVTVDVLANDSDTNNDPLSLLSVSDPPNGSAVIANGEISYTPNTDFVGVETFTYTVEDTAQASATATVTITIGDPTLTTLAVVHDTFLRQGAPNTSEGANTMMRVRQSGKNRALVQFDLDGEDLSGLLTATLVLTVQEAANNWGDGRVVFAHRVLSGWSEGNGFNANGNTRGTGAGATWNCATDNDVSDQSPDCLLEWDGGDFAAATGDGFVHTKEMTGEVVFDVTLDVQAGASFGWLIKKEEEGQSGRVEYESRESDPNLAARLVLERIGLGNLPPVATDDTAATFEDTAVNIDVLVNDSDPNGNTLTVTAASGPPNGAVVIEADGTITYTPDDAFVGQDTFTYTVDDGAGETATATVTVDVEAGPPPTLVAVDDTATTQQGQSVTLDVLANDSGGLPPLTVTTVTSPANGTATITDGGATVMYSPDSGFDGTDSFDYTVQDANGETATGTVTITVEDAPPLAVDDDAMSESGVSIIVDVLSNDSGDGIEVTDVTNVVGGITSNDDRNVTYTPQPDFVGSGGFDYMITDVDGDTSTAHVSVTVVAPTPIAQDDTATTEAGAAVIVAVLSNDTGVGLSVGVSAPPSNGTAVVNAGNTVTYTPNSGFSGVDTLVYTITDVAAQIATATVSVTVTPKAVDDTATTFVSTLVTIPVLANDLGAALSITSLTQPTSGTAVVNGASIDYTPSTTTGVFGFTYTITDASGQTATANVSVTVDPPPNQNPVAVNDAATTFETVPVTVDVLTNDSDPDTDPLTITAAGPAGNGSVVFTANDVTYTPNAAFDGIDTFTYTVIDGRGGSATATVTLTVENDAIPPTITATLSTPANANGWHNSDVTVTFDCQDGESGIATCTDPVSVSGEGADQDVPGEASDNAGNTASANVTISLDKTPPSVALSGPATGRRGQTLTVTAPGSDNLAFEAVVLAVDAVDVATLTDAPFEALVSIPPSAAAGSFVQVTATATDLAGNAASATPLSIEVLAGGFISGEVYDDRRGLPLAGASITVNGQPTTSGPLGRFDVFTTDTAVEVVASQTGYTTVERVTTVDQISGTVVLDARLTLLDGTVTTIGASGGSAANIAGSFTLSVPPSVLSADTDFRLTEVSGLGLRNVLPLGWSPVGSVNLEPGGTSILGSTLQLDAESLTGLSLVLVRHDETSNSWIVAAEGLTGDTFVTSTIDETGDYAFVVADTGATLPPPPVVDEPLLGVEPIEVFFGLSASSEVVPAVAPVSEDAMAVGSVVLFSPLALPSATLVSATVEESFESFTEGSLVSRPFTQEIPLYRYPLRTDAEVHQTFAVTPSRQFTLQEIREGRIHVSIATAPTFIKGALVGGEGLVVSGEGGAGLVVPAGALTETVSASVESRDPLELGIGFEGLTLVAAAEVDLSSASLLSPGTLSVPVALASSENLFAARYLFVAGQSKLRLVGPASFANGRISTSIDTGGTYLFFQSSEPLALVQGTVTEGASPANLVLVESSTTPFMDITPASGFYVVAAKLEATTITARGLVTGNQAVESVTPLDTSPLNLDLVLTTTGPFVTQVSPANGAAGVPLAPAITVTFSEPIDPNTVTTSTLSLTKADTTPVPGRVVVGAGNTTASFLPDATLDAITDHVLTASAGILDTTDNPLLPFTSSFTTRNDSIPDLNPDALTVSFPDVDGDVTVEAPAFSFDPNAEITILNVTNGIVVTGNVASDGSLFFELRAATTDELQIRVVDSSDRLTVIDKTEYIGPGGEVAIGRKGGRITSGEFTLDVPEGALTKASTFTLTPVDQSIIDALPIPEGAGGISSGVDVDIGGIELTEEADLSFPIDPAAPADASYMVFRKLDESGLTLYEVIDTASVVDGKVKTDSFPFSGVFQTSQYLSMWFQLDPATQKNPMGAIYGIVRETDGAATGPTVRPLARVSVRLDRTPLDGDYVASSDGDGNFVLIDRIFGLSAGPLNLIATDGARTAQAVAFTDPRILSRFDALTRFSVGGEVIIDFPLSPPPPPETNVSIQLFRDNAGVEEEITNGFATLGQELTIRVSFSQPAEAVNLLVNAQPVSLTKTSDVDFEATFTPAEARGYQLVVAGFDAFLNPLRGAKNFLAVQAGAGNDQPLAGPPSIITDTAVPRTDDTGVPVGQTFSVQFTEPVRNVGASQVQLIEVASGAQIPLQLVGTDTSGSVVSPVLSSSELVALTMTPTQGLKFGTDYKLVFSSVIEDLDEEPPGTPNPNGLAPDPTEIPFKTFTPVKLGEAPIEGNLVAMDAIDNRAFVAFQQLDADGSFGTLRGFDLSDPTQPTRIGAEDSSFVGSMVRGIAAESAVDFGEGRRDVVGVISFNLRSGNSDLTLFDVSASSTPYPYLGFVTTVIPGGGANSDIDLHENFAYVAAGTGGLKIVDISLARQAYLAENPTSPTSIPFEVSRGLFTRGVGFGQSSIVRVLEASDGSTTYHHTAVHVAETLQGRRGFVSGRSQTDGIARFTTVDLTNPQTAAAIDTVSLALPPQPGGLHVTWSSDIAFMNLDGQEIALVVGGGPNGRGTLAILDVGESPPNILSLLELDGSWGSLLAVDVEQKTIFIGTPEAVETYNLTDPTIPEFAGTIQGMGAASGGLAINDGVLSTADSTRGVQTATLGPVILQVMFDPEVLFIENGETISDLQIQYRIVPDSSRVISATIEIRNELKELLFTTPVAVEETGQHTWPSGQSLTATPQGIAFEVRNPDGTTSPRVSPASITPTLLELTPSRIVANTESLQMVALGRGMGPNSTIEMTFPMGETRVFVPDEVMAAEARWTVPAGLFLDAGDASVRVNSSTLESNELLLEIVPNGGGTAPVLDSIQPQQIQTQSASLTLLLTGSGFDSGDVRVESATLDEVFIPTTVSSTVAEITVPGSFLEQARPIDFRVISASDPLFLSESRVLDVLPSVAVGESPVILSISPSRVPFFDATDPEELEVELTGVGFQLGASVFAAVGGSAPEPVELSVVSGTRLIGTFRSAEWVERTVEVSVRLETATGTVTQTRSVPRREVPVILIAFEDSMFETLNERRPNEAITSESEKEQVKLQAVETIQKAFVDWEIRLAENTPGAVRELGDRALRVLFEDAPFLGLPLDACGSTGQIILIAPSFVFVATVGTDAVVRSINAGFGNEMNGDASNPSFDRSRVLRAIGHGIGNTAAHELGHQFQKIAGRTPFELPEVPPENLRFFMLKTCFVDAHQFDEKQWSPEMIEIIDETLSRK